MGRVVGIGHQDFETVRKHNIFYVDKTLFIKEWWEALDIVTLIARPRRFGKTLNMSMTEQFFSRAYEYDTPVQEAYLHGYWDEFVQFIRNLFNDTFKGNPYLERALMTGITRVSKESVFSDLNHLKVITATSDKYGTAFGFTEEEVFAALDEYGMSDKKREVKKWYDGFIFGDKEDIYNPWSIINYLSEKKLNTYWANTSSNGLVGKLVREGSRNIKIDFEKLLKGERLVAPIDEQIVYNQLLNNENAVWSLLLASGYMKAKKTNFCQNTRKWHYALSLTNLEIQITFENIIREWFAGELSNYSE